MRTKEDIASLAIQAGWWALPRILRVRLERFADLVATAERERICAAIKAEDDHCATGDYMLDSDDCIKVARGQWERPDYGGAQSTPQPPAPPTETN